MRSENSSSSPGESPQLGNPWDALLKNSLTPQVVDRSEKPTREKQNSMSNQSGSFSWKHLSFRKLSLGDRDGIPPLLRYVWVPHISYTACCTRTRALNLSAYVFFFKRVLISRYRNGKAENGSNRKLLNAFPLYKMWHGFSKSVIWNVSCTSTRIPYLFNFLKRMCQALGCPLEWSFQSCGKEEGTFVGRRTSYSG